MDKPLECSQCQNKITTVYTRIQEGTVESFHACKQCPIVQQKIQEYVHEAKYTDDKTPLLACSRCHTTLETLERGEKIGCPNCYEVFKDFLLDMLNQHNHLPIPFDIPSMQSKNIPLHVGKSPYQEGKKSTLSARLETLHIAMGEAIALENYEQAAELRDQIKDLMEKTHDKS